MKLADFLELVSDEQQNIIVVYADDFMVEGEKESIDCMLSEDVYKGIVIDVEASGETLKLWVKEATP